MQYFSDGYRPGDPRIQPAADGRGEGQGPLPADVDVLIVGSGPAGLLLAAQLAQFPEIVTRVVEKADGEHGRTAYDSQPVHWAPSHLIISTESAA